MQAQLDRWSARIEDLSAAAEMLGSRATFDLLIHIDELKALRAIAQSKLDAFREAESEDRPRLETEMEDAWNDLRAAF